MNKTLPKTKRYDVSTSSCLHFTLAWSPPRYIEGIHTLNRFTENSGHPLQLNFPFLERLKLRTIVYLADQDYAAENIAWCERYNIRICHIPMQSAKEPFLENDPDLVAEALALLLDIRNYPLLIHSNKGKHRW